MRKVITLIVVLFVVTNGYSQFSRGYNRTLRSGSYTPKVVWDYDFETHECVDKNTSDTVIMINGEEYEMYVYPAPRSFDKKEYWGNQSLELPKWIKKMIYNDVMNGKTYTEFLISPNYRDYDGNQPDGLFNLYNYKVVLKSKTNKIEKSIIGKGGNMCSVKLGDFNLTFKPETFHRNFELQFNAHDENEFDAVKNYLVENQNRLGIEIKRDILSNDYNGIYKKYGYSTISINYYLEQEWFNQANQLESFYKGRRLNSLPQSKNDSQDTLILYTPSIGDSLERLYMDDVQSQIEQNIAQCVNPNNNISEIEEWKRSMLDENRTEIYIGDYCFNRKQEYWHSYSDHGKIIYNLTTFVSGEEEQNKLKKHILEHKEYYENKFNCKILDVTSWYHLLDLGYTTYLDWCFQIELIYNDYEEAFNERMAQIKIQNDMAKEKRLESINW